MKPRCIDIHVRAKTDAPLQLVRNVYKINRELSDIKRMNYYDIEVHQATVKVVKEER